MKSQEKTNMTKLIIANWKAFEGRDIIERFKDFKVSSHTGFHFIICPPTPLLGQFNTQEMGISLGAQDCSQHAKGAFTGEVTASLLHDMGVKYCLIGHSERRRNCGETDEVLSQKLIQAVKAGIIPIFCVGETLEEREQGRTEFVLQQQLLILAGLKPEQLIIAYEPVWAIGGDKTPTPAEIQAVYQFIKADIDQDFQFVYGGSVSEGNAKMILDIPEVDGILVGRASTDPLKLAEMG